jgi:hypothetical protein
MDVLWAQRIGENPSLLFLTCSSIILLIIPLNRVETASDTARSIMTIAQQARHTSTKRGVKTRRTRTRSGCSMRQNAISTQPVDLRQGVY